MAKTDFKTVEAYHQTFSPAIRERLEAIRQVIRAAAPDAEELISYQIPAYKYFGYLIYYSAYQKHISLSSLFSAAFLEEFKAELAPFKTSKSAIQFPHEEQLPLGLIRKMVQFRIKENKANYKDKAKK